MKILEILTEKRKIGTFGERMAARYLRRHGYRIRRRNFVAKDAEIDLVAENRTTLVFVEVKTRTLGHITDKEPRPASSVTPRKQQKILSASRAYPGFYRTGKRLRYDVVEVYLKNSKKLCVDKICHLQNAFDIDTAYRRNL